MKICKKINYCWFGKKEKPELIKRCIESWKKYCSDYEIVEWNEENYDISKNNYMYEAYKAKKWAFVSDYARLDIIYHNGGIYLDTDVELIKPIDDIIDDCDAFFCYENDKINTGLGFGAIKENKLVKELLDSYENIHFIKKDGSYDTASCVVRNDYIFKKYINNTNNDNRDVIFFKREYFCPLDYNTKKMNKTVNTVAIHWYGESWLSDKQKFNNKIKFFLRNIIGNDNYLRIKNLKINYNHFKKKAKFNIQKTKYKIFYNIYNNKTEIANMDVKYARNYINSLRKHENINIRKNNISSKKEYDLTVIIPAYNSEKYIKRCIDSALNQVTKYKYKIVVVNDGSKDYTRNILESYKDKILLINQNNMGRSEARNTALKNISSNYIMFIDSDDYIPENCIEKLLSTAYESNYDIVEGNMSIVRKNKIINVKARNTKEDELSGFPVSKVYKSEIWENNFFLPGYEFEDTINKFMIYPFCKKKKKINDTTYYYCVNTSGITQKSLFDNVSIDSFLITEYYINQLIKNSSLSKGKILNLFLEQVIVNYMRCRYLDEEVEKAIFILTCDLVEKLWNDCELNNQLFIALKTKNYYKYKVNCIIA